MRSEEVELGLIAAQSGASYFDYVEQKMMRDEDSRMKLIENKQLKAELDKYEQRAKELAKG